MEKRTKAFINLEPQLKMFDEVYLTETLSKKQLNSRREFLPHAVKHITVK